MLIESACSTTGGSAKGQVQAGIAFPAVPAAMRQHCAQPTLGQKESALAALHRTGGQLLNCGAANDQKLRFIDQLYAGFQRPATKVR